MKKEIFFDVETKKIFDDIEGSDPGDLGVSIVSVYSRKLDGLKEVEGKMQSFWEDDFDVMWPLFQEADRIVGYNSLKFDVPAMKPYTSFPFHKLHHFDIMDEFKKVQGHRISLNALAKETLDLEKIDSGLNAVYYWEKGDEESLAKLKKYCEADVEIAKDLYDYILKEGHVLFKDKWNTLRKVELDFSYKESETDSQMGLF